MIEDFPTLKQVLEEYGRAVAEQYKANLRESGHGTQEDHLINSIETAVTMDDRSFKVVMDLNKYWKYLEEGTPPHWPPVDAIRTWISYKPVLPRPGKDGRLPTPNQLAYLIGRKIATVGTEGTHDLEDAKAAMTKEEWEARLRAALVQDVRTYLYDMTMGR